MSTERFNSIAFITNIGHLHIQGALAKSFPENLLINEDYHDAFDASLDSVRKVADKVVSGKIEWNPEGFLSIYPEYRFAFKEAMQRLEEIRHQESFKVAGAKGEVTVYCSRGCNWDTAPADWPISECAACGSLMHSDNSNH